ncbi:MAG: hypothetical protein QJR08_00535 [Bacillota bacterium]|nr:hypothetical protein [Bacillota bacterium]
MAARETGKTKQPLRFRVTVPPGHPAYSFLAKIPPAGRGQALLGLLAGGTPAPADGGPSPQAACGDGLERITATLERIARALEAMAAGGAPAGQGGEPDGDQAMQPPLDGLDALFGAFGEDTG